MNFEDWKQITKGTKNIFIKIRKGVRYILYPNKILEGTSRIEFAEFYKYKNK